MQSVSQCNCRLMQLGLALNSAGFQRCLWHKEQNSVGIEHQVHALGNANFWSVSDSSELPKAHAG